MLHTVIFDMDGLLIDSEPFWAEAMKEVFAELDVYLKDEDYAATTGLRTNEIVEYWYPHFKKTSRSPEDITEEILSLAANKILRQGKPMEGVEYILQFFKERAFKTGLASSSPMSLIKSVLTQLNIRSYFQALYSAEHEIYGKPHPSVYLSCANELQSKPVECLVFEDSINGMIAGKAARMKVVVVPEFHRRSDPRYALADMQLHSLKEFSEKILGELDGLQ